MGPVEHENSGKFWEIPVSNLTWPYSRDFSNGLACPSQPPSILWAWTRVFQHLSSSSFPPSRLGPARRIPGSNGALCCEPALHTWAGPRAAQRVPGAPLGSLAQLCFTPAPLSALLSCSHMRRSSPRPSAAEHPRRDHGDRGQQVSCAMKAFDRCRACANLPAATCPAPRTPHAPAQSCRCPVSW